MLLNNEVGSWDLQKITLALKAMMGVSLMQNLSRRETPFTIILSFLLLSWTVSNLDPLPFHFCSIILYRFCHTLIPEPAEEQLLQRKDS